MSNVIRTAIVAVIALLAFSAVATPVAAQLGGGVTGRAYFSTTDGASTTGGSFVITAADGSIVRQGTIGDGERAIFFSSFTPGETYTLTAVLEGYQQVTQTAAATGDGLTFNVVFEPQVMMKKTITIGVDKNDPTAWFLAEAPEGSTWTLTEINSGKVYSGTFSGALPQTISLDSAVGSGTYLLQIEAGPTFLHYEATVTMRGNSSAIYAGLTPDTSVVPM